MAFVERREAALLLKLESVSREKVHSNSMRAILTALALFCAFAGIGLLKHYRREPDAFWWPIAGLFLGVAGVGLLLRFRIEDISTASFRPGVPEDGLALLSIHTRAIAMVGVDDYGPEVARSWAHGLTAQGYGRVMASGEVFEVAVIDGAVIGFCSIKPGVICGLFVDPSFMRRGVATQLLSHALAWMKAQGCARVEIEATLTAVPFYLRHGFRRKATISKKTRGGLDMQVVEMER